MDSFRDSKIGEEFIEMSLEKAIEFAAPEFDGSNPEFDFSRVHSAASRQLELVKATKNLDETLAQDIDRSKDLGIEI